MTANLDYEHHWTVAEYLAMDDDQRYEIIDGELWMVPAPGDPHQRIITRLGTFIDLHVMENDLGECRHTPFDVMLADDTVVQPDFTFVAKERVAHVLNKKGAIAAPDLVIEVSSPSTSRRDRLQKRALYARFGVRWYVLVDPPSEVVEVFELNDEGDYVVKGGASGDEGLTIGCFPNLVIDLSKVWPRPG